ncbi:Ribonuclease P protein component [Maioricimonas rarisocia]|uniref:Ribonuclease P protein component n=1 Tax=Maioricimonas rarisocia TaxID=2528026 RepID=A0A517ZD81_9PLAN|nr:ribonuclease P protein component [Maioricimonas rarisocia]QDU40428.1 Ribonuclease P protein component [Maioricimonas rarisocia]
MTQFLFPKFRHLRKAGEFQHVYGLRQRAGDSHLLIFAAANSHPYTRIGLSVSKKHGNAVTRQRIKRLMREAFRLSQHEIPGGLDLILIPRQDSGAGLEDYQTSLLRLSRKLARRLLPEIRDEDGRPAAQGNSREGG